MDATIDNENHKVGLGLVIKNAKVTIVTATIISSNCNGSVSFAVVFFFLILIYRTITDIYDQIIQLGPRVH